MKTHEELREDIMAWVRGADRYQQNLESHLEYAGKEIIKIMDEYALQVAEKAFIAGRSKTSWMQFKKEIEPPTDKIS